MIFKLHITDKNNDWWEQYNLPMVSDIKTATRYGQELLREFNADCLQLNQKPRYLMGVSIVEDTNSLHHGEHHWEKYSLVTERDRTGYYNRMFCHVCGCEGRLYGLASGVTRVGKWKAKKFYYCKVNV